MLKLKHYILSIGIFLIICYLSFFKPPSIGEVSIPHLDKLVHFTMYFGFASVLWFDFLRRKKNDSRVNLGWFIGCLLPILVSGIIELLQEYCTTYRGGEWLDFLANSLGALSASCLFYFILRKKNWYQTIVRRLSKLI